MSFSTTAAQAAAPAAAAPAPASAQEAQALIARPNGCIFRSRDDAEAAQAQEAQALIAHPNGCVFESRDDAEAAQAQEAIVSAKSNHNIGLWKARFDAYCIPPSQKGIEFED